MLHRKGIEVRAVLVITFIHISSFHTSVVFLSMVSIVTFLHYYVNRYILKLSVLSILKLSVLSS